MTLREAMQAVYDRHGMLTPALVLEAAHDDDDVGRFLHGKFEWDDEAAANGYRLRQAQDLIRRVRVTYRPTPRSQARDLRAFVAVATPRGRSYEPVDAVAADPLMARLALQEMERDWQALKAKWGTMREFVELVQRDLNGGAAA